MDENQKIATFNGMVGYLPDRSLGDALVNVYKTASPQKCDEMFELVAGVIGCDESEIAKLVIDLCPNDWRAWFVQAKIRQIRVRWCELEGGFFGKKLPKDAIDVLGVFYRAYQLAKNESEKAKETVLSHISTMQSDNSYKVFIRELNARINREG